MRQVKILIIGLVMLAGSLGAASFTVNVLLHLETRSYRVPLASAPEASVVIIPGASVYPNGVLSPLLKERADTAVALYTEHRVTHVLVSGDSTSPNHDEVGPLHAYLLAAGVRGTDILLDPKGVDTYSTLYRARYRYHITSALIASQSFHLPRAVFIARALGIAAYGVVAGDGQTAAKDAVREFLADEKALLNVTFARSVPLD